MADQIEGRRLISASLSSFLALIAEPAFLLVDSIIIGRLGSEESASLAIAGNLIASTVGLFIFLAYGTTTAVSRAIGSGNTREASELTNAGFLLAIVVAAPVGLVLFFGGNFIISQLAEESMIHSAKSYLNWSLLGLPAIFLSLAATGMLRAYYANTDIIKATVVGFSFNAGLNFLLVYPLGLGLIGSAIGTVLAQNLLALLLVRQARRRLPRTGWRLPGRLHLRQLGALGWALFLRTLALRVALLLTLWLAADSTVSLASYQIAATIWTFLSFILDALAIAGQPLIAKGLGAHKLAEVIGLGQTLLRWGGWLGAALGVTVALSHRLLPLAFSANTQVQQGVADSLLVIAALLPIAGVVFVLDGVLIGAGDGRWLARAGLIQLAGYAPLIYLAQKGQNPPEAVWLVFGVLLISRGVMLYLRFTSKAWATDRLS